MLSRNDAALPRRRRGADGPAHAPALAAGVPLRGSGRSATARRCARGCSARTWWCSATRRAALGVLGEHCPHRGASLAFGRNEECGLRCLYHGWKFDVEGNVLDMSSEPRRRRDAPGAEAEVLSGARGGRLRLDLDGRQRQDARVRAAGLGAAAELPQRDREDARRVQLGAGARRLDRLGAQLEPAFDRHADGPGRRRQGHQDELAAPVDRQGAEDAVSSRPATAFATPPSASRS